MPTSDSLALAGWVPRSVSAYALAACNRRSFRIGANTSRSCLYTHIPKQISAGVPKITQLRAEPPCGADAKCRYGTRRRSCLLSRNHRKRIVSMSANLSLELLGRPRSGRLYKHLRQTLSSVQPTKARAANTCVRLCAFGGVPGSIVNAAISSSDRLRRKSSS